MPDLHGRPKKLQERIFTRLFEAANIAQFSGSERIEYEDSLKVNRDLKKSLDTAVEEGRAEGIDEGIKKGRAEGALQRAIDIGKNLLLSDIDRKNIAEITGLPIEEIKLLEKNL
jgi:predicted transposase/invertase (TIGR01784 family)